MNYQRLSISFFLFRDHLLQQKENIESANFELSSCPNLSHSVGGIENNVFQEIIICYFFRGQKFSDLFFREIGTRHEMDSFLIWHNWNDLDDRTLF